MLNSLAERLKTSKLGRMLVNSPAWQDMMMDLHLGGLGGGLGGLGQTGPLPFKGLPQLPESIKPQSGRVFQQDWSWRPNFSNLPLPDLNGWRPARYPCPECLSRHARAAQVSPTASRLFLLRRGAGNCPGPRLAAVHGGCGPAVDLVEPVGPERALRPPPDAGRLAHRPRPVTTRSQLILAFDYLALLRLGEQAAYWNHRTIAFNLYFRRWIRPPRRRAALGTCGIGSSRVEIPQEPVFPANAKPRSEESAINRVRESNSATDNRGSDGLVAYTPSTTMFSRTESTEIHHQNRVAPDARKTNGTFIVRVVSTATTVRQNNQQDSFYSRAATRGFHGRVVRFSPQPFPALQNPPFP